MYLDLQFIVLYCLKRCLFLLFFEAIVVNIIIFELLPYTIDTLFTYIILISENCGVLNVFLIFLVLRANYCSFIIMMHFIYKLFSNMHFCVCMYLYICIHTLIFTFII